MKAKNKKIPRMTVYAALLGLEKMLKIRPADMLKKELMSQNCCIQIKLKDHSQGRYFTLKTGMSVQKRHPSPRCHVDIL